MRVYFIDRGVWFNTLAEAKAAAQDAANAHQMEVRASTVWITTDRKSLLTLLNGGAVPVRRRSIQFIARPVS